MLRAAPLLLLVLAFPSALAAQARIEVGGFSPLVLEAEPGESVTWTNVDDRPHTVTSSWDDGATFNQVLRPGESFTHVFEAGEYDVHCVPHATHEGGRYEGMVMRVRVAEPAASPPAPGRGAGQIALIGAAGGLALLGLAYVALRQRGARA